MYCSFLDWFQLAGLSASDGIVPDLVGVFQNWTKYCSVTCSSWCGGTPALFSCFRKYSRLLALDRPTMILIWVVQDKLASKWRPTICSDTLDWASWSWERRDGSRICATEDCNKCLSNKELYLKKSQETKLK